MIHLLDTDIFIMLLRGTALAQPRNARETRVVKSAGRIRESCRKALDGGFRVGLSAITLAELEYGLHAGGCYKESRPDLERTLVPFEQFAFDPIQCVQHYGSIRAAVEKAGKTIGPLEMLIAANALALDAMLITHNTREFRRVPGLAVEDWA
ncbi:PIN domain-containing protein [Haloferula sp. A504]|uniref:PIN domain-containing protein n=1 Tax=Haloferula sp. A504 TaxID=3373601 RepID=UPI0031CA1EB4|nr:PIN domain-containing protein [Verrucomicrobiaceae bacterium E54]